MSNDIATRGTDDVSTLPAEVRAALPYDPRLLVARSGTLDAYRAAHPSVAERILFSTSYILIGGGGGVISGLLAYVAAHGMGAAQMAATGWTTGVVAGASGTWLFMRSMIGTLRTEQLAKARRRIEEMTSSCTDEEMVDVMRKARTISRSDEKRDMATIARLDAVAMTLAEALHEAGPDVTAAARSRRIAETAVTAIVSAVERPVASMPRTVRHEKLELVCSSLAGDRATAPIAPTARITRILSVAERALERHPNLVDATGGRIDDLVRRHVPRLLALRAEAIETARPQDMDAVDAAFQTAFDGVASSIEEGVASIHDETMDRLSTEMRFLSSRRGDPLLTAAS